MGVSVPFSCWTQHLIPFQPWGKLGMIIWWIQSCTSRVQSEVAVAECGEWAFLPIASTTTAVTVSNCLLLGNRRWWQQQKCKGLQWIKMSTPIPSPLLSTPQVIYSYILWVSEQVAISAGIRMFLDPSHAVGISPQTWNWIPVCHQSRIRFQYLEFWDCHHH